MTTSESRRSAPILRAASRRLRQLSLAAAPGDFLGSETELIALLGVSRPTFRQAVRLLEQDSLIAKRMGAKGGCYAARPDVTTLVRSASLVLRAADATLFDMLDVNFELYQLAISRAAERAPGDPDACAAARDFAASVDVEGDPEQLARFLQQERGFDRVIFGLANNPVLTLFGQISRRFVDDHPSSQAFISQLAVRRLRAKAWMQVATAVADGDAQTALDLVRQQHCLYIAFVPDESGKAAIGEIAVDGPALPI